MADSRYDPDDEGQVSVFLVLVRPDQPIGLAFDLETAYEQAEQLREVVRRRWREPRWSVAVEDPTRRIRSITDDIVCEVLERKIPVSVRTLIWSDDPRKEAVAELLRESLHEAENLARRTFPHYDWLPSPRVYGSNGEDD